MTRRRMAVALTFAALLLAVIMAGRWSGFLLFRSDRVAVIEALLKTLNESYTFPEVAHRIDATLRKQVQDGKQDRPGTAIGFAHRLTADLQALSQDRHLRVRYSPLPLPTEDHPRLSPEAMEKEWRRERSDNFGFRRVERWKENIGYIELRRFADPDWGGDALAAAMNRVGEASALIIDLRRNNGGDPRMGALIASYFFAEPVHYVTLDFADHAEELWTQPTVPGRRFLDKPIFLLTSRETFSAAEGFAYHLRNLRRATLIGERTGGGANPGVRRRIGAHFSVFVPIGRSSSAITGANWERTGVTPDIEAPADKALNTAQAMAAGRKAVP